MQFIKKKKSPKAFEEWKIFRKPTKWHDLNGSKFPEKDKNTEYKYYSKEELREELLCEQFSVCCYCEMAIQNDPSTTAIDHVIPREGDTNTELIFDYSNLGLSCNGGRKDSDPKTLHCDARKDKSVLPIRPYERRTAEEIGFQIDGKIKGETEDAIKTISILGLDTAKLDGLRKGAIDGYIYEDRDQEKLISKEEMIRQLIRLKRMKDLPFRSAILTTLSIYVSGSVNAWILKLGLLEVWYFLQKVRHIKIRAVASSPHRVPQK